MAQNKNLSCRKCDNQYEVLYGRPVPWCATCKSKELEVNFKNWSSGNSAIDEFIRKTQLKAKHFMSYLEWIEPDQFSNIKYVASGGFGLVFTAQLSGGREMELNDSTNEWRFWRSKTSTVALKQLNSSNMHVEFLQEVYTCAFQCCFVSSYHPFL